jgi:hypothetical protein
LIRVVPLIPIFGLARRTEYVTHGMDPLGLGP